MLKYVVEFLGTFLFLSVVVATTNPLLIALALLTAMVLVGGVTGAHLNPAISSMFWMKGSLSNNDLIGYVAAQVLGGFAALTAYKTFGGKAPI
jgi:aquaporin Z